MHRKKDGGADDESGGVQVGGWRQRPVVEVQRGKSGGDSSGSPLTWRRTCPERARGACGAADGRTPGGRRGRIARKRGKHNCLSWPDRGSRTRKFCVSEAVGRRKDGAARHDRRLRSAGAGGQVKPVQRFGGVRSDRRCLIFLRHSGCVANGFPGTRLRAQRLGSVVLRRTESDFGQRNSAETFFFASRKKFPCK